MMGGGVGRQDTDLLSGGFGLGLGLRHGLGRTRERRRVGMRDEG